MNDLRKPLAAALVLLALQGAAGARGGPGGRTPAVL